ncbi:MAG: hypothetical protein N2691_00445 [Patescibacteria group bacterium]|nr:hypothetical protein [Patescibacteria group bacterium]
MAHLPTDKDDETQYPYQYLDGINQSEDLEAVNETDPDLLAESASEDPPEMEGDEVPLSSYHEEGDEDVDEIANLMHPGVDEGTDE